MAVPQSGVPTAILIERARDVPLKVVIGVDPHKGSHTAVAVEDHEVELSRMKVRASGAQLGELLAWAEPFEKRTRPVRRALMTAQPGVDNKEEFARRWRLSRVLWELRWRSPA